MSYKIESDLKLYIQNRVSIDQNSGCWLWQKYKNEAGYGLIGDNNFSEQHGTIIAHRLSFIAFKGHIEDGLFVRHQCRNRHCVDPDHLEIGTPQDNSDDMVKDDTQAKGSACGNSKLTEEQVLEMRRIYNTTKISFRKLAKQFDVDPSNVSCIIKRITWKHI